MTRYRKALASSLTAFALLAAACGNPTSPSDTTTTVTAATGLFAGTLSPLSTSVYPFTFVQTSTVALTLASVAGPSGAATPAAMALAFGTTDEAGGCVHSDETLATPALTTHLTVTAQAGSHCVEISDPGSVAGPVTFAVRIVTTPGTGTLATTTPAAGGDSFTSNVPVLGSATRAISASQAGTISVNLTGLTPATAVIGLGLGIPRVDGGGCYLNVSIDATTGAAPMSVQVDPGLYCVRVFDSGFLTSGGATFILTTAHP